LTPLSKTTLEKPGGGALVTVDNDEAEARNDPGTLKDDNAPAEVALTEVLAQLGEEKGAQAKCMVWRIPGNPNDDEEFLYEVNAVDFAKRGGVSGLAKRYGAGIYRIRVYSGGHIYTHKRVKVGAPVVQDYQPATEIAQVRGELNTLAATMTAAIEKAVLQRPQTPLIDQLKELAALKDLFGGGGATKGLGAQMKETLELVALMKATFGSGSEGESGFTGALGRVAEKYLPQIIDGVNKGNAADGAPRIPPVAAPERSITEGERTDMGALRDMQLKMALDFLVNSAARGLPAETYADVAVDQVPPADLAALLDRPDWLTALSRIDERAQQHAAWFSKLREEILSVLRENGVPLTTPAPVSTLEGGSKPLSS
jgi:hypothetical protein